jgi:hypothetical protein
MHQHKADVGWCALCVVKLTVTCQLGWWHSHQHTSATDHALHLAGRFVWLVQLRDGDNGVPSDTDGSNTEMQSDTYGCVPRKKHQMYQPRATSQIFDSKLQPAVTAIEI